MKKDIYDYLGVGFFEDYILPTNPSSKNLLFKKIYLKLNARWWLNRMNISDRIQRAYIYGGMHLVGIVVCLIADIYPDLKPDLGASLLNLWVNIYPILVQLRTRKRLVNILSHKTKSDEKNIEIDQSEKDIEDIKCLIHKIEKITS